MNKARSVLVGLAAAALLAMSGTAVAAPPPSSAQQITRVHPTSIRFLPFAHVAGADATIHVRGQVSGKMQGTRGALPGAVVKLYRQFNSSSPWVYLGSQPTGGGAYPQFDFPTVARMNARYKVVYGGGSTFRGSSDVTWVVVHRLFHGVITDGPGAARLHGNVTPFYTHKTIWLQKRSCAACGYVTVKKATTGVNGAYSFSLNAPPNGRWWWRVAVPGTGAFMASYGSTYTTELI